MSPPLPSSAPVSSLPRAAAGVEVLGPMAGSGYRTPPVLVRRGDGQMVQLSPLLAAVLEALDGRRDAAALADRVEEVHGRTLHPEDLAELVATKLVPLGLVQAGDGPEPALRRSDPLLGLRGRIQLAGPERTAALARPFTWLFRPVVVVAVLVAFTAFSSWVVAHHGLGTAIDEAIADPMLLLGLIGLVLASGAFHELGHAAACCYGGARPRAMGAAVYLVWPAFYTDVTDSYRLDRRGRLRVDLGGLYFNTVVTLVTGAAWLATGTEALLVMVPVQLLQMARQLVPIVRFDGYHILADLVGVPDLFARIRPTLARAVPGRRRPDVPNPLTPRAQAVVVAWVVVVVPFLLGSLGLLLWNLPGIVTSSVGSLRLQWELFTGNVTAGRTAAAVLGIVAMGTVALLPASAAYLSARIAHRSGSRFWSATEGRPAIRTATISVAAVVLIGAVAPLVPRPEQAPADLAGSVVDERAAELAAGAPTRLETRTEPAPAPAPVQPPPAPAAEPVEEQVTLAVAPSDAPAPVTAVGIQPAVRRPAWPFSFPRPAPAGPGGNQALAVGTVDGATKIALATSLEWLVDQPMRNRNEAYAFAQCVDCRTVAVAFQIVAASGDVSVVVPENLGVSVNETCDHCTTGAAAVQLAVTLVEQPPESVKAQVKGIVQRINGMQGTLRTATLDQVLATLEAARAEALALLDPWIVDADDQVEDPAEVAPEVEGEDGAGSDETAGEAAAGSEETAGEAAAGSEETAGEAAAGSEETIERSDGSLSEDGSATGPADDQDPVDGDTSTSGDGSATASDGSPPAEQDGVTTDDASTSGDATDGEATAARPAGGDSADTTETSTTDP